MNVIRQDLKEGPTRGLRNAPRNSCQSFDGRLRLTKRRADLLALVCMRSVVKERQAKQAETKSYLEALMRVTRLTFLFCLFISAVGSAQDIPAPNKADPPSKIFGLTEDITSLSIVMIREFPFVAATVNGVPGKIMFDTGSKEALSLNAHKAPLKDGKVVGKGTFGSGQTYEVKLYPEVAAVAITGGPSYRSIPDVMGQDLSSMEEEITPDFLGFIGHDFYRGYLFKLDYKGNRITFYRQTAARRKSQDYLSGETVVAVVPFTTRKLPNHPLVPVTIGGVDFLGTFDTGMDGAVYMTKATQARLTKQRLLTPVPARDDILYNIAGVSLTPGIKATVSGIHVFNETPPSAAPIGTPEPDIIQFGYAFLRQYKTVWDFSESRIYLLNP